MATSSLGSLLATLRHKGQRSRKPNVIIPICMVVTLVSLCILVSFCNHRYRRTLKPPATPTASAPTAATCGLLPWPIHAPTVLRARGIGMADPKEICDTFYLALVVYREARGETLAAKVAVAHTVLNRVAKPKWWGKTIDEVITKKWQYSSLTDPKDPQLVKWPLLSDPAWQSCLQCAIEVLRGALGHPLKGADSYYDDSIAAPAWTTSARYCGKIGRLNFYDVDKDYEEPALTNAHEANTDPPPLAGRDT